MSIFIGKDYTNKSCCIISKTETTENIKLSPPSISNNFAIDTRRDLLFCEVYNNLSFSLYRTYSNMGLNYNVYRLIINDLVTTPSYTKRFMLFINNYSTSITYTAPLVEGKSVGGVTCYYYGTTFIDIHTIETVNNCSLITFYHTIDGLNIFNKYDSSNSINLSSSKFIVNGVNYFKEKFMVTPPINSTDLVFNFAGVSFQVVNSIDSGSYSFSILSSNNIKVLSGTKLLFDSTATYLQAFLLSSSNSTINFTIPMGYAELRQEICTLPSTCKILGITFYPRIDVYPNMKLHGIITNSNTIEVGLTLELFPVLGPTGGILNGFIQNSFYLQNNKVYIHRLAKYDGDPQGVFPAINMRLEYFILSE